MHDVGRDAAARSADHINVSIRPQRRRAAGHGHRQRRQTGPTVAADRVTQHGTDFTAGRRIGQPAKNIDVIRPVEHGGKIEARLRQAGNVSPRGFGGGRIQYLGGSQRIAVVVQPAEGVGVAVAVWRRTQISARHIQVWQRRHGVAGEIVVEGDILRAGAVAAAVDDQVAVADHRAGGDVETVKRRERGPIIVGGRETERIAQRITIKGKRIAAGEDDLASVHHGGRTARGRGEERAGIPRQRCRQEAQASQHHGQSG